MNAQDRLLLRGLGRLAFHLARRAVSFPIRLQWRLFRIRLRLYHWALIGLAVVAIVAAASWTPIARDVVIASYAHVRAGQSVPFDPGYTQSAVWTTPGAEQLGRWATWGIATNSPWVLSYTKTIVPYMEYEGLTDETIYPNRSILEPRRGTDSFLNGGYASVPEKGEIIVSVNDRYVDDLRVNDARQVLVVLVHELVHIQGGNFLPLPKELIRNEDGEIVDWLDGTSARLESATEAATQEILAAMCEFGDKLACQAFWLNLEDLARGNLRYRAMRASVPALYDIWADAFFRERDEEIAAAKANRFWQSRWGFLSDLLEKYSVRAWEQVRDGICGQPLDTGIWAKTGLGYYTILGLKFDDTQTVLGRSGWFLRLWC